MLIQRQIVITTSQQHRSIVVCRLGGFTKKRHLTFGEQSKVQRSTIAGAKSFKSHIKDTYDYHHSQNFSLDNLKSKVTLLCPIQRNNKLLSVIISIDIGGSYLQAFEKVWGNVCHEYCNVYCNNLFLKDYKTNKRLQKTVQESRYQKQKQPIEVFCELSILQLSRS